MNGEGGVDPFSPGQSLGACAQRPSKHHFPLGGQSHAYYDIGMSLPSSQAVRLSRFAFPWWFEEVTRHVPPYSFLPPPSPPTAPSTNSHPPLSRHRSSHSSSATRRPDTPPGGRATANNAAASIS